MEKKVNKIIEKHEISELPMENNKNSFFKRCFYDSSLEYYFYDQNSYVSNTSYDLLKIEKKLKDNSYLSYQEIMVILLLNEIIVTKFTTEYHNAKSYPHLSSLHHGKSLKINKYKSKNYIIGNSSCTIEYKEILGSNKRNQGKRNDYKILEKILIFNITINNITYKQTLKTPKDFVTKIQKKNLDNLKNIHYLKYNSFDCKCNDVTIKKIKKELKNLKELRTEYIEKKKDIIKEIKKMYEQEILGKYKLVKLTKKKYKTSSKLSKKNTKTLLRKEYASNQIDNTFPDFMQKIKKEDSLNKRDEYLKKIRKYDAAYKIDPQKVEKITKKFQKEEKILKKISYDEEIANIKKNIKKKEEELKLKEKNTPQCLMFLGGLIIS